MRATTRFFAGVLSLLALTGTTQAATFSVTTAADSGPGSLREAMTSAYATAIPPHAIEFSLPPDSVIALEAALPSGSNAALFIDGGGASGLTIDGQGQHRIFVAGYNNPLTLHNLNVRNGFSDVGGGCIVTEYGNSPIALRNMRVEGCKTAHANAPVCGGALLSYSTLFVNDARFVDNVADSEGTFAMGGAICARNLVWIENSHFRDNHAIGHGAATALGGALAGGSPLTVLRSQFVGNRTLQDDPAVETWGGAIYARNDAKATLRQSLFIDNTSRNGAAVCAAAASFNEQMQVVASNNTFAGNHGGPALWLRDTRIDLRNNSFWRNTGAADLGAHLTLRGAETVVDAFANNLLAASGDGGPLCSSESLPELFGTGYNLFADASCDFIGHYSLVVPGDWRIRSLRRIDADPQSMPVLDLFADSPAIDNGNPDVPGADTPFTCSAGDARDNDRPMDGNADGEAYCDVGSHELQHEASLFADDYEEPLLR